MLSQLLPLSFHLFSSIRRHAVTVLLSAPSFPDYISYCFHQPLSLPSGEQMRPGFPEFMSVLCSLKQPSTAVLQHSLTLDRTTAVLAERSLQ